METKLEFDPGQNVLPAFITAIGRFDVPDAAGLNAKLAEAILERQEHDPGQQRSNRGGWHSGDDLLRWPQPEIKQLGGYLRSAVDHMTLLARQGVARKDKVLMTAWANVSSQGAYNMLHAHPHCHWSGVYYVQAGDHADDALPAAGHLVLYDPRGATPYTMPLPAQAEQAGVMEIEPVDGLLLVFPAWLQHSVNPFQCDTQRISISFNAVVGGTRPGVSIALA